MWYLRSCCATSIHLSEICSEIQSLKSLTATVPTLARSHLHNEHPDLNSCWSALIIFYVLRSSAQTHMKLNDMYYLYLNDKKLRKIFFVWAEIRGHVKAFTDSKAFFSQNPQLNYWETVARELRRGCCSCSLFIRNQWVQLGWRSRAWWEEWFLLRTCRTSVTCERKLALTKSMHRGQPENVLPI